jgi:hypothetical protein
MCNIVQVLSQWKSSKHVKETVQGTHQVEVPLCRDGIVIAVICDAILKELCPHEVLIFEG